MVALLVAKQARELWRVLLACAAMLGIFFTLASFLFGTFGDLAMRDLGLVPPELLTGLFGGLVVGLDPLVTWLATLLVHPLALTVFAAAVVSIAARCPAGEVDRGTLDLLLALPIARRELVAASIVLLQLVLWGLTAVVWSGLRYGLALGAIPPPANLAAFGWVVVNLWALFSAVAGIATLVSTRVTEQGRVTAIVISFLVLSFFVNLIASIWEPARFADVVSLFHYYQPHPIVRGGGAPLGDLGVLLGVALVANAAAFAVFGRRDIPVA